VKIRSGSKTRPGFAAGNHSPTDNITSMAKSMFQHCKSNASPALPRAD
jgi:hypothetical protein